MVNSLRDFLDKRDAKTGDKWKIQKNIQKEAEEYANRDNKTDLQKDSQEDMLKKSGRYLIYTKEGTWEDAQPKIDELSCQLAVMSEKMAGEMSIKKHITKVIAAAVSIVAICAIAMRLTYYNPTIGY